MTFQALIDAFWSLFAWVSEHPDKAVGILILALSVALLAGAAVFAIWSAHEEKQQDKQRREYEALVSLSSPEARKALPPPLGARPPRARKASSVRAAGFNPRKVS